DDVWAQPTNMLPATAARATNDRKTDMETPLARSEQVDERCRLKPPTRLIRSNRVSRRPANRVPTITEQAAVSPQEIAGNFQFLGALSGVLQPADRTPR